MAQESEYKIVTGNSEDIQNALDKFASENWRPILMTAAPTGAGTPVALSIILEHNLLKR